MRIPPASLAAVLAVISLGARSAREPARDPLQVTTSAELEAALSGPRRDATVVLASGVYELDPESVIDSTCGNCADPDTPVPVTAGLTISGRNVRVEGPRDGSAVIVTRAGYGLYFEDCVDCELDRVVVTGGERDTARAATDAAIVAKNSSVSITNCVIRDNVGNPAAGARPTAGIAGICGRENADVTIAYCEILRNSWDGIALYRDARATISNNVIDGVEGGPEMAIRVTGASNATIERNLIQRYWMGIGVFVDADVVVYGNVIEQIRTWGINISDEGSGRPRASVERNVVYDCGACGIAVRRHAAYAADEAPGRVTGNIVVQTGQNSKYDSPDAYCVQCALALEAVPDGFSIRGNVFYDNREASAELCDRDTTKEMFWRERRGWVRTFRNTGVGVDGRVKFHESAFLSRYPRWWD